MELVGSLLEGETDADVGTIVMGRRRWLGGL